MDPILILLVVVLGVFIVFQVINGRKRRRETETRQSQFVPGVEIMTNYGLYGTIVSIDDEKNLAVIETVPGTQLKIHRQTILKVADYDTAAIDEDETVTEADALSDEVTPDAAATGPQLNTDSAIRLDDGTDDAPSTRPQYGEKVDDSVKPSRTTDKSADQ